MNTLILISSLGGFAMLADILKLRKLVYPIALLGLIGAAALAALDWNGGQLAPIFKGMLEFDHFAILFSIVMIVTLFFWLLMSQKYLDDEAHAIDHIALVLFALVGGLCMVSYQNLTMLFIGIEILSISMYVLCGSNKNDLSSNESALKYFLMGSFATGFLLFGIALIYGATGSFDIMTIADSIGENYQDYNVLVYSGVIMLLIGMLFKVSAVPFHFWAPDVYQGAPTHVTAYMATIVKTAAFAAFFRLFFVFSTVTGAWLDILTVVIALTIIVSNTTAVFQQNVKRMLAYSSISHAGYMLLALISLSALSINSVLFYTAAYSIGSIAAFTVLLIVASGKNDLSFDAFNGLAKSNPVLAFVMTLAMLSLAGIPPTAGFFAKYTVFNAALNGGHTAIVLIAVIGSLISLYYYFKVIIAMYFKSGESDTYQLANVQQLLLVLTSALTIALGLFPDLILRWM
jgi:NADH-quinone oxidoreductase subunit N